MPENNPSPEEKEFDKQAAIAQSKKLIAEATLAEAKAKKEAAALNDPISISDKEQAENEKAIATAQKEAALAKRELFKGPEIAGNTGKISSTGDFIESRILAQQTLSQALSQFAVALNSAISTVDTLVIYNPADFVAMESYASMLDGLKAMDRAYSRTDNASRNALDKPMVFAAQARSLATDPMLIGFAAAGIVRTAADIVSLFRTTSVYTNTDITVDELTIAASLKAAIIRNKFTWKVFYPALYPVNTIKPLAAAASDFTDALNAIQALSQQADSRIAELEAEIERLKTVLAAETDASKKVVIQKRIDSLAPLVTELRFLNTSFTQLQTTLSATDPALKITGQALLLRAERITEKLNAPNVYVVKISAVSKGSNIVSENLWRNASIKHSGGTELNALVFAADGELVFSDTRYSYIPYKAPGEIEKNG